MTLDQLKKGMAAQITAIKGPATLRQRLATLGILKGHAIELSAVSPWGNPRVYRLGRQQICLRTEDAQCIEVMLLGGGNG